MTNGCFSSKATEISSLSWRRTDRFSAQNGKDDPNPRAARAWQRRTIKNETNDKENNDRLIV
jgi:hypothetical protein